VSHHHNDDLTPFGDEPVFKALTGPAGAGELAGEAEALAAFRAAGATRPRRRLAAARIGTSGGILIAAFALSGGAAAAAYTGSLPSPVQNVAGDVFGPIGVPFSGHHHHHHHSGGRTVSTSPTSPAPVIGPGAAPVPPPTSSASPSPSPSGRRGHKPGTAATTGHDRRPKPSVSPTVSVSPSPSPSATPTPTPTPTPVAPVPATVTASVSASRVPANAEVVITGQLLTSGGAPVRDHRVALFERLTGQAQGQQAAVTRTDSDGDVTMTVPPITHDVLVGLRTGNGVRSAALRVVEVPTISVAVAAGSTTDAVTVTTNGAQPGDSLALYRREQGRWVQVGSDQLDSSGAADISVPAPKRRPVHYRVALAATRAHAGSGAVFTATQQ
jgi:hypothetical protein